MLESKDSFITPCYLMTPYHRQQSLVLLRRQGSCRLIVCFSFASRKSIECRLLRMRSSLVFSSDFCSGVQSLYILPSGWRFSKTKLNNVCPRTFTVHPENMDYVPNDAKFTSVQEIRHLRCFYQGHPGADNVGIPGESNAALLKSLRFWCNVWCFKYVSHDLDELPKCI